MNHVEQWLKSHKKKTFYLAKTGPNFSLSEGNAYYLIWNDKEKTKYGTVHDGMYTRYGFGTIAVLKGETPFDLWIADSMYREEVAYIFPRMLEVRNGTSMLPEFDLTTIKNLKW